MNTEKFNSKVSGDLLPGESVLVYVKVNPKGNIDAEIIGVSASMYGGMTKLIFGKTVNRRIDEGNAERAAAGINLDGVVEAIAGLTQKRLILWKRTFMGNPGELIFSLERSKIRSIEMGKSKLVMIPMPAMRINLTEGKFFELLVGKVFEGRARKFCDY